MQEFPVVLFVRMDGEVFPGFVAAGEVDDGGTLASGLDIYGICREEWGWIFSEVKWHLIPFGRKREELVGEDGVECVLVDGGNVVGVVEGESEGFGTDFFAAEAGEVEQEDAGIEVGCVRVEMELFEVGWALIFDGGGEVIVEIDFDERGGVIDDEEIGVEVENASDFGGSDLGEEEAEVVFEVEAAAGGKV